MDGRGYTVVQHANSVRIVGDGDTRMNRLPLPQNNPKRQQQLDYARAAANDLAQALRYVEPDLWPEYIAYLVAQLAMDDVVLERLRRILDNYLAFGTWPEAVQRELDTYNENRQP